MVRGSPVKARPLYKKDPLPLQQVIRELHIVMDVESFDIQLREAVKGSLRLNDRKARDRVDPLINKVSLLRHASCLVDIPLDRLRPAERCLNNRLCRNIGTEPHRGKHLDSFNIILRDLLIAGEDHPADPEARDHVGFRKPREGHTEKIRCKGSDRRVRIPIHQEPVINLIGKEDELMLSGNLNDSFKDLTRIDCAGRIIRVDNDDRLRLIRDLALHVKKIRIPLTLLVTDIVNYFSAGKRCAGSPERIIRCRDQDLIPVIEKC